MLPTERKENLCIIYDQMTDKGRPKDNYIERESVCVCVCVGGSKREREIGK